MRRGGVKIPPTRTRITVLAGFLFCNRGSKKSEYAGLENPYLYLDASEAVLGAALRSGKIGPLNPECFAHPYNRARVEFVARTD